MKNSTPRRYSNDQLMQDLRDKGYEILETNDCYVLYREAKKKPHILFNPWVYLTSLLMWVGIIFGLMAILSGCSVKPGVIEFEPVIDQELYDLTPYENNSGKVLDKTTDTLYN